MTPEHHAALNSGTAQAKTLTEALAIDQLALMHAVIPDASHTLVARVEAVQELGILARMRATGEALAAEANTETLSALSHHRSDTVRGWACFMTAANTPGGPSDLYTALRPLIDDEHFTVREWVWMAARPRFTASLAESIRLLSAHTGDASAHVRRFSSEALRPRGVWAPHIAALKEEPEQGRTLLDPLINDPARSVQDSVANWVNDASKTRPEWAQTTCSRWLAESPSAITERIVHRALRSLRAKN